MTSTSGRGWQDKARDDPSLSEILYVLQRRRLLIVGVVLAIVVAIFARVTGLDRDRAFYPVVTIVEIGRAHV